MKRNANSFSQRAISVVIDIAILFIISISFWIVAENASGYLFPHTVFVNEDTIITKEAGIFSIVFIFLYYGVAAFNKWNTIGKIVSKNWRRVILSFSATVVDFTCALIVTLLLDQLLQKWLYIETFNLLFVVLFCYALFSGLVTKGKTIGKYFFGINLQTGDSRTKSLQYEMCKFSILIVIPYFLLRLLGIVDSYAIFLNIVFFTELVVIFSFMCCKRTLWAKFAGIQKVIQPLSVSRLSLCFFILIAFFTGGYALLQYNNNKQQLKNNIMFQKLFPEYPNSSKVQPYTDFMKTQTLSPKEYILSLFERYDIVILEEAYHAEGTLWELVDDIVFDSLFIKQVGNIFTEYGSAMHQNKIDTFLHTVFQDETELGKETAVLMRYMSGDFYYFIKNLNLLNATLPDSLKVREHYCDNADWDYFPTIPFRTAALAKERDSLMAQVTIDWYRQQVAEGKRHKCLVVTNTRHAFGYPGGVEKVKNSATPGLTRGNQGQYIFEAFPDKTANVTRNVPKPYRSMLFFPVYNLVNFGIWDKAFELNEHRPVGFNLKNTPFGEDFFNPGWLRGANSELKYSDIYTGVIFDRPYTEFKHSLYFRYPYQKFATEKEARRKGITDINQIQAQVGSKSDDVPEESYFTIGDIGPLVGMYLVLSIMGLSILLSFVFLLKRIIHHYAK